MKYLDYVSAKLLHEAIRKSRDTSAKGMCKGLEQLQQFDLGGFRVDFAPDRHTGSRFVDLSVITTGVKLLYR